MESPIHMMNVFVQSYKKIGEKMDNKDLKFNVTLTVEEIKEIANAIGVAMSESLSLDEDLSYKLILKLRELVPEID